MIWSHGSHRPGTLNVLSPVPTAPGTHIAICIACSPRKLVQHISCSPSLPTTICTLRTSPASYPTPCLQHPGQSGLDQQQDAWTPPPPPPPGLLMLVTRGQCFDEIFRSYASFRSREVESQCGGGELTWGWGWGVHVRVGSQCGGGSRLVDVEESAWRMVLHGYFLFEEV